MTEKQIKIANASCANVSLHFWNVIKIPSFFQCTESCINYTIKTKLNCTSGGYELDRNLISN